LFTLEDWLGYFINWFDIVIVLDIYDQYLRFMVFNVIFKIISVISWRSVLLVEETGENHQPVVSHWQTLS
jgi:energy-converting hydrogenase Eha subunit E